MDPVLQFSHRKAIGQVRKLLRLHPLRTGHRFEPVDKLVVFPELLQPPGARLPCVARAPPCARFSMGTSRGEVHDVLLMEAEHGMYARLHEQREMRIGAKAPVCHQDIARAQVWMQCYHLGELMGAQGGRQQVYDHPGTRMKQGQQVGNGEAAPRQLLAGLAEMVL